jgi:hypothetical protein
LKFIAVSVVCFLVVRDAEPARKTPLLGHRQTHCRIAIG